MNVLVLAFIPPPPLRCVLMCASVTSNSNATQVCKRDNNRTGAWTLAFVVHSSTLSLLMASNPLCCCPYNVESAECVRSKNRACPTFGSYLPLLSDMRAEHSSICEYYCCRTAKTSDERRTHTNIVQHVRTIRTATQEPTQTRERQNVLHTNRTPDNLCTYITKGETDCI